MQVDAVGREIAAVDDRRPVTAKHVIPSLDGLRAICVCVMMLSHYKAWSRFPRHGVRHVLLAVFGQGSLSVMTFFVISGLLITTLLLNERERSGRVQLRRFYLRRCIRIFPPFYLFLVLAIVLAHFEGHPVSGAAGLSSATYVYNYAPFAFTRPIGDGWYVGHTWSLSVQEQFYFAFPLLLIRLSKRRLAQVCAAVLVAAPFLRLGSAVLLPIYRQDQQYLRLFHCTIDVLLAGALAAMAMRKPELRAKIEGLFRWPLLTAAVAYLVVASSLRHSTPMWYECLFGVDLTVASILLLVLYVIFRPASLPGRLLNWKPLRHVGAISYGMYLWQQIFFGPFLFHLNARRTFLVPFVATVMCAEISYWAIERPTLRFRSWMEKRAAASAAMGPAEAMAGG